MELRRHLLYSVGLATGLAALLVGFAACSSESTPEPTAAVVATVAPTAVAPATATVEAVPMIVPSPEPTAAVVSVVRPTSTAPVSTAVVPTATLMPNATATPIPTIVYAASPTPTLDEASTTEAAYNAARLDKLGYRAYGMALTLADEHSPRQSATDEELEAAMFLSGAMDRLGYETSVQEFEVTEAWASGSLEVLPDEDGDELDVTFRRRDGNTARIPVLPFEPLKVGIVEGELVDVGLGSDEDFEGLDVEGKIALMGRGEISFEEKETNAAENGAIAAVVYNNEPRYYFRGQLDGDPDILASSITRVDGGLLFDALEDGEEFDVELIVYPLGNGPSRNVIAELNNDIDGDQVVLVGAHYDTTPWSSGANDNGSGVAAAMVVADELADDELPFDLRFVFFGSEETGLHGSTYYANDLSVSQLGRIEAMINLDVVATGELSALGSESLIEYAIDAAEALNIEINATDGLDGASSDHAPFDELGVSVVMVYADDLTYINHPSDTIEHLNAEPMGQAVAVVLGIIERLAGSIEP